MKKFVRKMHYMPVLRSLPSMKAWISVVGMVLVFLFGIGGMASLQAMEAEDLEALRQLVGGKPEDTEAQLLEKQAAIEKATIGQPSIKVKAPTPPPRPAQGVVELHQQQLEIASKQQAVKQAQDRLDAANTKVKSFTRDDLTRKSLTTQERIQRAKEPAYLEKIREFNLAGSEQEAAQDAVTKAKQELTQAQTVKPAGEPSKLDKFQQLLDKREITQEQFDAEKVNIDLDTQLAALKEQKIAATETMSEEKYLSEQAKLRTTAENERANVATRNLSIQKENLAAARDKLNKAKTPEDIKAAFVSITKAQNSVENATNAIEGANMNARRFKIMQDTSQAQDGLNSVTSEEEKAVRTKTIQKNEATAFESDLKAQSKIRITRLTSEIQSLQEDIANLTRQKAEKLQGVTSSEDQKAIAATFDNNIKRQELNLDSKQKALKQEEAAVKKPWPHQRAWKWFQENVLNRKSAPKVTAESTTDKEARISAEYQADQAARTREAARRSAAQKKAAEARIQSQKQ